jgi:hypothetical protein
MSHSSPLRSHKDLDGPEEEALYRALAEHSDSAHTKLTLDQVRLIKRMFDRSDKKQQGYLQREEIESMLLSVGDDVAHRVLRDLINSDISRLTFPDFVRTVQSRLSVEETVRLMDLEVEYIQSMGIDTQQLQQMENFKATKQLRSFRSQHKEHVLGSDPGRRSSVTAERRPSAPNDVEEYRKEFGFEEQ